MLLGSSRPYPWLILEENGRYTADDDDDEYYEIFLYKIFIIIIVILTNIQGFCIGIFHLFHQQINIRHNFHRGDKNFQNFLTNIYVYNVAKNITAIIIII